MKIVLLGICSAFMMTCLPIPAEAKGSDAYHACMEKYRKGSTHTRAKGVRKCIHHLRD